MKNSALIPKLRFPEFKDLWNEQRLEEITSTFQSGKNITAKFITADGKYPVFGGNGLRGYTDSFNHEGCFILIGRQGALCGNINLIDGETFVSEHAIAVQANNSSDIYWLAQKLDFMNLNQYSESSAQPGLAVSKLGRLKLKIPSLPEQQKIAAFLTAVDDKIQSLSKKKALLERYKKGVIQQIFNQEIRFKDENGNVFLDWEEKKLRDVCENIYSGKTKPQQNGEYSLYGSTGIIGKCASFTHSGEYILIARVGANAGIVNMVSGSFSVTDNTLIVDCKSQVNTVFIYYVLIYSSLNKLVFGSGQPLITSGQLKSLIIRLPVLEEQTKIANFLSAIDNKINYVNQQIAQTKLYKKGLLQQMFV